MAERKSSPQPLEAKVTSSPTPEVGPGAFYTPEVLLAGCLPLLRTLVDIPDEAKIGSIRAGTMVKLANATTWIWVRVTGIVGEETHPESRLYSATITSTLPPECAYNTGTQVRFDGRRVFGILND